MAHEGIFATSIQCTKKMGKGYDSINVDEAYINQLCLEIEGYCNSLARHDFSTNWASLSATAKPLLTEIQSNYCGFYGAMYSSLGYASGREQENIMNTNWARFVHGIGLLKNQETVTFIKT